jgi:transcriptional regulator with XRE-family HTH domain
VIEKQMITEELKAFGSNLKRQRSQRSITQEKLAELADLNIRTIQKIEAGQTNILITTALRLQESLQCEWKDLMQFK